MTDTASSGKAVRAPLRLVVLISGTGTNLRAIADAIDEERCAARVVGVISDKPSAPGLMFAEQRGIPTRVVRPKTFVDRAHWDRALTETITGFEPDLVVLAGFMRIVGLPLIERYPRRIINVHPSLLPAFPGADGPAQALAAKVRITGCTVHLVDTGVDSGPIIAQAAVPVLPDDDVSRLHARIQHLEHGLLPAVIDAVAAGHIELHPDVRYLQPLTFAESRWIASPALLDGSHPPSVTA